MPRDVLAATQSQQHVDVQSNQAQSPHTSTRKRSDSSAQAMSVEMFRRVNQSMHQRCSHSYQSIVMGADHRGDALRARESWQMYGDRRCSRLPSVVSLWASGLLILVLALGTLKPAAAALGDYMQCCSFSSSSTYDKYAIDRQVRFWKEYSASKCYRIPDGNSQSAPTPQANWWVSHNFLDGLCQDFNNSQFGGGARCDINRTARCYSATTTNEAYDGRRFCQCGPGYLDSGAIEGASMDGCLVHGESCVDVDECEPQNYPSTFEIANTCDPMAQCVNTPGSFLCNCAAGASQPEGWAGAPGVRCAACTPGKYKGDTGPEECTNCPAFSNTTSGALSLLECQCNPGYMQNGALCTACPPGSFKQLPGDHPCLQCPVAKYSSSSGSSECLPCPVNSTSRPGSSRLLSCTCLPGHSGADGQECRACLAGSAKAANGSRPCEVCNPGKFSETAGSNVCSNCPEGSSGPEGSASRGQCQCIPGMTPDTSASDELVCIPCEAGKFKSLNGTAVCEECPPGRYSEEKKAERCKVCSSAFYNPVSGATGPEACLPCSSEGNIFSFPGSVSEVDCAFGADVLKQLTSNECGSIKELPTGSSPSRNGHSLARVLGRIYLFGGYFMSERNDVWYYEIVSATWIQILIGPGDARPLPRTEHTMVEIEGSLIIFAGRQGSSRFNDLWEFRTRTDDWVELLEDGNSHGPVSRYAHSAASIVSEMFVFGGQDSLGRKLDDFWKWDSSGWTELISSVHPAARAGHRMARSGISIFLFGGRDAAGALLNDLWEFASSTLVWSRKQVANAPSGRYLHAMQGLGPIVLVHGGATANGRRNDLWQYDTFLNIWVEAIPDHDDGMKRRQLHQMVDLSGTVMIHGGAADSMIGAAIEQFIARDSWRFVPCICLLPGTISVPSSYSCISCESGTYKDWYGAGSCLKCPVNATGPAGSTSKASCICVAGFYSDGGDVCNACPSGKFNMNGSQPCQSCAGGTISALKGLTSCTSCPAGTFSEEDNGNGRAVCVTCPKNSTSIQGSKSVSDCKCIPGYSGNTECTPCLPGEYKAEAGPGLCSLCPAAKFSTVEGATSESKCKVCPSSTSSAAGANVCECIAGFYPVSELGSVCAPCEPGSLKAESGNFECSDMCKEHETSFPGATSANDCFCVKGFSRKLGLCSECDAGTFKSEDGDSMCISCPEGKYSDSMAATSCTSCPDVNSISKPGISDASSCVCKSGYYLANHGVCMACDPGTFKDSIGPKDCQDCSVGTFSAGRANTFCRPCPSFSTSPERSTEASDCLCRSGYTEAGVEACSACAAGKFKGLPGRDACQVCDIGKYSSPGSTNCTDCPGDSFTTTIGPGSTSAANCTHCKPGYTGIYKRDCTPCQPGTYKSSIGSSGCLECTRGSYQEVSAAINCTLCGPGKFASDSSGTSKEQNACTSCPAGKTSGTAGMTVSDCGCYPGYSGPNGGSGECLLCVPGKFKSHIGPDVCLPCPSGTFQELSGSSACTPCLAGKYLESNGSTSNDCIQCHENSNSEVGSGLSQNCLCNPGFGITLDGRCEACLPGKFKNRTAAETCSDCPQGSYTDPDLLRGNVGHINCSLCKAGTYSPDVGASSATVCKICAAHSTSSDGSSACICAAGYSFPDDGVMQPEYCLACRPGFYKEVVGDHACSPCPIGTFSDSYGRKECSSCPWYSSTGAVQAAQENECHCRPGYTGENTNYSPCRPCSPGRYKASLGSSDCILCAEGKYSNTEAGTSESVCKSCFDPYSWSPHGSTSLEDCVCQIGYYLPPGVIFCTSCQKGKYKSSPGDNSSCLDCPGQSTTLYPKSASLEECLCLPGYTGEPANLMSCSLCEAGHYKASFGTARCHACPSGKYLNSEGATSELDCRQCPDAHQWSRNGSTTASACICAMGYTRIDYATACSSCIPGWYKPNPGDMPCTQCEAGTFSTAAARACSPCPQYSASRAGSGQISDCICNKGYTGSNGGVCSPCSPGRYKSVNGSTPCSLCSNGKYVATTSSVSEDQCIQCPPNASSHRGSVTIDDCVCDPGFMGIGRSCIMCPTGKYKHLNGSQECTDCVSGKYSGAVGASSQDACTACPLYFVSASGSGRFEDCMCVSGYTLSGSSCVPCAPGSYKMTNGTDRCKQCSAGKFLENGGAVAEYECLRCPIHSLSPEGSDSVADCLCSSGYTGNPALTGHKEDSTNQACNPCEPGTYKTFEGSSACLTCGPGKYGSARALSECQQCPPHSSSTAGSFSIDFCVCNAGHSGSSGECTACPPGTFKTSSGSSPCSKCGAGKYSNVSGATTATTCMQCATGADAPEGSDTSSDCICHPGFTGAGQICHACEAGKFKPIFGSAPCDLCSVGKYSETAAAAHASVCKDCPLHSNSLPGSNAPQNCTCNLGYSGYNGQICSECVAGKYKDWQGQGACTDCPQYSYSTNGANSVTVCTCNAGYTGSNGFSCMPCDSGSFKAIPGPSICELCPAGLYSTLVGAKSAESCILCPANSISSSGAPSLQNCTCNAGFQKSTDGVCQACPVGTYKNSVGNFGCQLCPEGRSSDLGGVELSACFCDIGYAGAGCVRCAPGTYKDVRGSSPCIQCPKSKYSTTEGAVSMDVCTQCPLHMSSAAASSDLEDCRCIPGFRTTTDRCEVCPSGKYSEDGSAPSCTECEAGLYSMTGSTNVTDCGMYSFSVQASLVLNNVGNAKDFVSQQALFISSWVNSINQGLVRSSTALRSISNAEHSRESGRRALSVRSEYQVVPDYVTITKICDNLSCFELVKNSASVLSSTPEARQVSVEFQVKTTSTSASDSIISVMDESETLLGFESEFFRGDTTKSASYSILPKKVPSMLEVDSCGIWYPLKLTGDIRSRHCMAQANGKVFTFGGLDMTSAYMSDLRQFDVITREWITMISDKSLQGPTPRIDARLIGSSSSLLLFGGRDQDGNSLNELWSLNLLTWWWDKVVQASVWPTARFLHAVTDDENGGFFMFGGKSSSARLNDLWHYESSTSLWVQLKADGGPGSPSGREGHALTMIMSKLYMFGGFNPTGRDTNDLWEYDVAQDAWKQIFPSGNDLGPSVRHGHSMTAMNGSVLLFGGEMGNNVLNDIWEFRPVEMAWYLLQSTGNVKGPSQRSLFAMTSMGSKIIVYAGRAQGISFGDTWEYTLCECAAGSERIEGVCRLCQAGTFKKFSGPQKCTLCPSAKFSASVGAFEEAACVNCPAFSWAPSGSSKTSQCLCSSGYTQNGSICAPCSLGTFKDTNGTDPCTACARGSFSSSEAASLCIFCPTGKYGASLSSSTMRATEDTACLACPENSISQVGSSSSSDCTCFLGYMGKNGSICIACLPGQYKDWNGEGRCRECAAGKYSGVAARDRDCELCAAGKYSNHLSATLETTCEDCPALSHSSSGASSLRLCLCIFGYTGVNGTCSACAAGKFKSVNGSTPCVECPAGTYSTSNGLSSCTSCAEGKYSNVTSADGDICISCPSNSISDLGSGSIIDCLCNAGFSGIGGICAACPQGTFKPDVGADPCTACPAGKYSGASGALTSSACQDCPLRSESPLRSSGVYNCTCEAGAEQRDAGTCELCPPGKFKGSGAGMCVNCPFGSWNVEGSTYMMHCKCGQGYFGPDGQACAACVAGKYKPTNGSDTCTDCAFGKFGVEEGARMESSCQFCADHASSKSGANSSALCLCHAGYESGGGSVCNVCVEGKYKSLVGPSPCLQCPAYSHSPLGSTGALECVCNKGYTANSLYTCSACDPGTYKSSNGSIPCLKCAPGKYGNTYAATASLFCLDCPPGASSSPGSSLLLHCKCNKGYSGRDGSTCLPCETGKYKPANGSSFCTLCSEGKYGVQFGASTELSCQLCPPNSYSVAGSNSSGQCACKMGFFKKNVTCTKCPAGTYKSEIGDGPCTLCPENRYGENEAATSSSVCKSCPANSQAIPGSVSLSGCVCNAGHSLADFGCSKCPQGKYKIVSGNQECTMCAAQKYSSAIGATSESVCMDCVPNTKSVPGSVGSWQCLCDKGWTGSLAQGTAECTECPWGTYKEFLGKEPCTKCGKGKYSDQTGGSSETSCKICAAGTTTEQTGSTTVNDCVCDLGTTGGGGAGICDLCPSGTYKDFIGPGECVACALGKYSGLKGQIDQSVCQSCPVLTMTLGPNSTKLADCLCNPGFEGDHANKIPCSACPVGTFKREAGTDLCRPCLPGSFQNNTGQVRCVLCPEGRYNFHVRSNSSNSCALCPKLTYSLVGSPSLESCLCNAGYSGPNGGPCAACVAGFFKGQAGPADCVKCAAGTWENRKASTVCSLCISGKYSNLLGSTTNKTCIDCPDLTISWPGAQSIYGCLCMPGYTGPDGGNCTACDPGFFKNLRGNATCSSCEIGTYAEDEGMASCANCPEFSSTSSLESTMRSDCLCVFGYSGNISQDINCLACEPGSYKPILGASECIRCGNGKYSSTPAAISPADCTPCADPNQWTPLGSVDISQCQCGFGFTLPLGQQVCQPCTRGKFKSQTGDFACSNCRAGTYSDIMGSDTIENCVLCPPYSESLVASSAKSDCRCMPGFSGSDGGPCNACPRGKFKALVGNSPCLDCSAGAFADSTNTTACILCSANKYSAAIGAVSELTCQDCPAKQTSLSGSDDRTDCRCTPGYTGPNGVSCSPCLAGSFKLTTGNAACESCSRGSYISSSAATACLACGVGYNTFDPGSQSVTDCICDLGYFKEGNGCSICGRDTYKDYLGAGLCFSCMNHTISKPGSVRASSCKCIQGFTGPDGGVCVACLAGTYKPVNGSGNCTLCGPGKFVNTTAAVKESDCSRCPGNTISIPGSASISQCLCNAGFSGQNGRCSVCAPGKYKPVTGTMQCTSCSGGKYSVIAAATSAEVCLSCPINSLSQPGSGGLEHCLCNIGYTGLRGNCTGCRKGTYKPTNGSDSCIMCGVGKFLGYTGAKTESECKDCPKNSTSQLGSTLLSQCLCLPGYTGLSDPGNCTACPKGSFKNHQGSAACVECEAGTYANSVAHSKCIVCPNNSFSAPGSTSMSQCTCNSGYTGSLGVCTACRTGTFKNETGPANCTLCNAGTYSNKTGQSSVTTCMKCPKHTFSAPGSVKVFDCVCNPGYFGNATMCSPCKVGKFKTIYGSSNCLSCEAGKYGDVPGLDICRNCVNNTHSSSGSSQLSNCICNAGYTKVPNTTCNGSLTLSSTVCFTTFSCISCSPGTYKSANGSATCDLCGKGKYLDSFAAVQQDACMHCPQNSSSPPGSASVHDCACNHGFTGVGVNCTKCEAGKYKSMNGSAPCTLCGAGKYSAATGATSANTCNLCPQKTNSLSGVVNIEFCTCNAGSFGPNGGPSCSECIAGEYQDEIGKDRCKTCPTSSTSGKGSEDASDCKCVAGFYAVVNSTGVMHCNSCPVNHTSVQGSSSISECVCTVGYSGPGGGICVACEAGTVKPTEGSASCNNCVQGKYSPNAGRGICISCPIRTTTLGDRSTSLLNCVCAPGSTNFGGPNGVPCTLCPLNTYKPYHGSQNCSNCPFPAQSVRGSTKFDDCQCEKDGECFPCPTGSFRTWVGDVTYCIACEPGMYSDTVGATSASDCRFCPENSQSQAGTSNINNCSCNAGYKGVWEDRTLVECRKCQIGFYKNWNGSDSCAQCPSHSSTLQKGSDEIQDCLCNVGFTGLYDSCRACVPGTYKDVPGSLSCTDCSIAKYGTNSGAIGESTCASCPNFSTSVQGSSHVMNCSCMAGYNGSNGLPCTACPPRTYKFRIGDFPCTSCPLNSISNVSSSRLVDCLCDYGYYGENGTICSICESGKYKDRIGPMNCTLCAIAKFSPAAGQISESSCQHCPANATSDPGSWQSKQCLCNPGFWGKNGSVCTACAQVHYKQPLGEAPLGLISDCIPCPANSWSPFASPYCKCNIGYGGPDQNDDRDRDCMLCAAGKYKNWRGSAECESCHERIKPSNSLFVDPTSPLSACKWECRQGYYYPDKKYLDSDSLSFTRLIDALEPAWFAWYELDEYQVTTPKQYYSDTRRYLPNSCEACATVEPVENPCGYGEYWSAEHCSTDENNGCKPCVNDIGDHGRYVFPNPYWLVPQCPYTCAVGYYNAAASDVIRTEGQIASIMYPECTVCPPPLLVEDGSDLIPVPADSGGQCPNQAGDWYQCGAGMGSMGVDTARVLFTKVFNWDGKCWKAPV